MSKPPEYYHVFSKYDGEDIAYEDRRKSQMLPWMCSTCTGLRPGWGAVDVRICTSPTRHKPLTFATDLGLVWRPFLAPLDASIVARDLMLGRVFDEKGNELEDWATFHGRYRVIVRGTEWGIDLDTRQPKTTPWRVCAECRQKHYYAAGKKYLFPAPPGDGRIFESHYCGLILAPNDFEVLVTHEWRKRVYVEKLNVTDLMYDGDPSSTNLA